MLILTLLAGVQSGTATVDNTPAVSPKAEKTQQFHSWVNTGWKRCAHQKACSRCSWQDFS